MRVSIYGALFPIEVVDWARGIGRISAALSATLAGLINVAVSLRRPSG